MATEVDEIGGDVIMWPLKLRGYRDVNTDVDEIGGDIMKWLPK